MWRTCSLAEVSQEDISLSDSEVVQEQSLTFGNWAVQLKLACEADRLEDIEAIASLRSPRQVALRHKTVFQQQQKIEIDGDTVIFSTGGGSITYRDELIPFKAMSAQENGSPLPDFPPQDSENGRKLKTLLLRHSLEFGGRCLFWVRSVGAMKILEAQGANTHDLGWMGVPLLVYMAENGSLDIVRFLLDERGHDPNIARKDGNYTALHWAKSLDTVRLLIERGGDANALTSFGDSVLAQQFRTGQAEVIDYLLGLGEEKAARANLLHWLEPNPEILRVLIRHGIPLDQPITPTFPDNHYPPLAMQRILSSGLDKWERTKEKTTKAEIARDILECIDILLAQGWNPMTYDESGRLPYHVIEDWLPDTDQPLRRALDERLARHNGARKALSHAMDDES